MPPARAPRAEGPSLPSLTTPLTLGGRLGVGEEKVPSYSSWTLATKVNFRPPRSWETNLRNIAGGCGVELSEGGNGLWCLWVAVAPGTGRTCGTRKRKGQTAGRAVGTCRWAALADTLGPRCMLARGRWRLRNERNSGTGGWQRSAESRDTFPWVLSLSLGVWRGGSPAPFWELPLRPGKG